MARRKKKDQFRLSDPETAIAAGLIMTMYSWETECRTNGWREDTPMDLASSIVGASAFAEVVFDADVDHLTVSDMFSEKSIALTGIGLTPSQNAVVRKQDPDSALIKFMSENLSASLPDGVPEEQRKAAKESIARLRLDAQRLLGQLS